VQDLKTTQPVAQPQPDLGTQPISASQGETLEPQKRKFFSKTIIAVFIIAVILIILPTGIYFFLNSNKQIACTAEAKLCPDGSSVGRTGPKCEFAKCPTTTTLTPASVKETFLKIPEYGVQIKLSSDIKDAYYVNNATADKGYVYLKVHSLDNEPQCSKDESSTAALSRVGKDEMNVMVDKKYSDSYKGVTIGNYFYYIDLAQYECATSTEGKALLEKVRAAFTNTQIIK
jgi:hypothetical protein